MASTRTSKTAAESRSTTPESFADPNDAMETTDTTDAVEDTDSNEPKIVAKWSGNALGERRISKADIKKQFDDYDGEGFVFNADNQFQVDVTDVPEGVRDLLKSQPNIDVRTRKG